MDRRELLIQFIGVGGLALTTPLAGACQKGNPRSVRDTKTQIAFVKTNDRMGGIATAIDLLKLPKFKKRILLLNQISTAPMKRLVRHITTL